MEKVNSDNTSSFECPEIPKKVSKNIQGFFESREFFDLLLKGSDGIQIRAHRIFVCASSEYFLSKLRSMPKETKPQELEVEEFDSVTLELVLQFMYTSAVDLCLETATEVLKAADHFQMTPLKDLCCSFLAQELNTGNCLATALFAKEYSFKELSEKSFAFVYTHFEEICFGREFLELDEENLDDILSENKLGVSSEEKVIQFLVMWLEHDRKNREKNWLKRLSNVRYQFLTDKFITEITGSICINFECHKLIHQWLEWHFLPEKRSIPKAARVKSRKSYQHDKLAFVSGYYSNKLKIQTYYPKFNTWTLERLPSLWDDRLYNLSAIVHEDNIIIAGGTKPDCTQINEVKMFNIKTGDTDVLPSMKFHRSSTKTAILRGFLYVIGGFGIVESVLTNLTSVERYDFSTKKWEDVPPLLVAMYNFEVVALNNLLYVVGPNSMQCYFHEEETWLLRTAKTEISNFFGLAAVGEYLFTVGGRLQNGLPSSTVERYNPISDTWMVISSLKSPREHSVCLAFNKSLMVLGGSYIRDWVHIAEEFNIETCKWRNLAPLPEAFLTLNTVNP